MEEDSDSLPKKGWMIEKMSRSLGPSGMALNVRELKWVPVSDQTCTFPTARAARIYAEENGFIVDVDVLITFHEWD